MLRRIKDYVFIMVCIISHLSSCAVFVSAPFVAKASDVPSGRIARSIVATDTTIMMEKATHVLIGKVEGIESRWKEETRLIYTYIKVHVEELLKGTIQGKYVVIKHKGGEVGDIGVLVSDEPHFLLSEEVKVFLKHEETGEFTVYDGKMGGTSLVSPVSSGFNYTGIHWARSDLPVPYYINENRTIDEVQAVQASIQTWEDDPESFMDYTYMGPTTRSNASLNGYNVVSWRPIDGPGGTLAQTAYWYDRTTHARAPNGGFTTSISYLAQTVAVSGDVADVARKSMEVKILFGVSVLILLLISRVVVGVLVGLLLLKTASIRRVRGVSRTFSNIFEPINAMT